MWDAIVAISLALVGIIAGFLFPRASMIYILYVIIKYNITRSDPQITLIYGIVFGIAMRDLLEPREETIETTCRCECEREKHLD